jgi:hypothetical protein
MRNDIEHDEQHFQRTNAIPFERKMLSNIEQDEQNFQRTNGMPFERKMVSNIDSTYCSTVQYVLVNDIISMGVYIYCTVQIECTGTVQYIR